MEKKSLNKQLVKACENFTYTKVRRLIKKGADPNTIIDDEGRSALNWMAWYCANKTVKFMTEAGADLTQRENKYGNTPLLSACASGGKETVEILLEAGSDINETANDKANGLMYAVNNNFIQMVKFLKEKGINMNAQNDKGQTALIYAISREEEMFSSRREEERKEQLNLILELLKYGADINLQDSFGNTALTHAVYRGNLDTTKLLLENGADINAPKKSILMTADEIPDMDDADEEEIIALLKSYDAKSKPYFARYKINVNCKECGKLMPLNSPAQELKCNSCLTVNELIDKFWGDIFEESYSEWSRNDSFNVEYEICNPRCLECDTELDTTSLKKSDTEIICPKCKQRNSFFPSPEWFKKFERYDLKPTKIISGISFHSGSDSVDNEIKPIAIRCVSCAAALSIKGSTPRNCTCEHCGTVQYLPDPVWKALHPVKKREDWYIYYSN